MSKKFSIRGDKKDLERFRKKLRRLKRFGDDDFIKTAQDTAAIAVRFAQGRVPVKTGDLKRSIHAKREGDSVFIGAEMDYAAVVEFGSTKRNTPAKPYFYNSIRDAIKNIDRKMNNKFRKINNE
jgi:phage gpG-like protein